MHFHVELSDRLMRLAPVFTGNIRLFAQQVPFLYVLQGSAVFCLSGE